MARSKVASTASVEGVPASAADTTLESSEKAMKSLRFEDDGKQKASATEEAASESKEEVMGESSRTKHVGKHKASESKEEAPLKMEEGDADEGAYVESSEMDEDTEEGDADEGAYVESSEMDEDTKKAEERWNYGPAVELGHGGVILVLFETPSGFAIFVYDGIKLLQKDAYQNIWADFADDSVAKKAVWLVDYQTFEDKLSAINVNTGVSDVLAAMIKNRIGSGQKLAVDNEDYKRAIENSLKIDCLYDPAVKELMWGLKVQMPYLVPKENQLPAQEDRFPICEGMKFPLKFHKFRFNPDMMVTRRMIKLAGVMHESDQCVNKHSTNLHSVAVHLKEISDIDTQDWDLLKIASALKLICYPDEEVAIPRSSFSQRELARLWKDKHKYDGKILKRPLLVVYDEICWACQCKYEAARVLRRLLHRATKAYEGPTDHETGPDGEKVSIERTGFGEEVTHVIDELTECNYKLSEERKKRQIPPTLAPISALKRYTHISSYPLHSMNEPGISSIDIHPSKDIVATGGIDSTAVLFDRPSGQILCTLAGHSKKITSLKFVSWDELVLITGSADKTVRIWRGSEDGNYSCIHTLKDHTAEVEAVTAHATQKYFVTASMDNSWHFYDILTGSCLAQVREASEQEGYTSASFHPDGLLLGTGTTAGVKIWDVKTQSNVAELRGQIGPVTAMSFSENGYHLATAVNDGVMIWDLRKRRDFMEIAPYCSDTPTNAVEFDLSGSYLALGGSDIRVFHVDEIKCNYIKRLPDRSRKGKVTSVKFGADAKYIAVGSMDHNLRIFGLPGDKQVKSKF